LVSRATELRRQRLRRHRRQRCGARLRKRPGRFCRKWALKNHWRCAIHGGKSTGPRLWRFDEDGRKIVPNYEALQRGAECARARRRLVKAALERCGLADEWPN